MFYIVAIMKAPFVPLFVSLVMHALMSDSC